MHMNRAESEERGLQNKGGKPPTIRVAAARETKTGRCVVKVVEVV